MTRKGFEPALWISVLKCLSACRHITHRSILLMKATRGTLYRFICLSTVIVCD